MHPMTTDTLSRLDLEAALVAEASAVRNLVPTESGWSELIRDNVTIKSVTKQIASVCRSGASLSAECEFSALKPGHGIRPVAFWGPVERVIYRALTTAAVAGITPVDRSVQKYVEFVKSPLTYSDHLQKERTPNGKKGTVANSFRILESDIKYVVKSDLTAFYQQIDHELLADELLAQGSDYAVVVHLTELLQEVTGRAVGIPQLYDASDQLSEVYVDSVERKMLQRGFAVWRFNDDFRIACRTFSESIMAIEELDSSARSVGLTINESKTFTYRFFQYLIKSTNVDADESKSATIALDDVEATAGDYTDDFNDDLDAAAKYILSASPSAGGEDALNIADASREQVRKLRRAYNALAQSGDTRGISNMERLLQFLPSLTPDLINYLVAVSRDDAQSTGLEILDSLRSVLHTNNWQKAWIVDAYRRLASSSNPAINSEERVDWIRTCFQDSSEPLRGFAFDALASSGAFDASAAVGEAAVCAPAVKMIYLAGVRNVYASQVPEKLDGAVSDRAMDSLRRTDAIHRALLQS